MASRHSNGICTDGHAWPSSYYGRTRRIDLAQLYCDTLARARTEKQKMAPKKLRRRVRFTTDPPVVHEYEREEQEPDLYRCRRYDGDGRLRIATLDLRPIPNSTYATSLSSPSSSSLADAHHHPFPPNKTRLPRPSSPSPRTLFSYDTFLRAIIKRKAIV